jgi:hypothetical protein
MEPPKPTGATVIQSAGKPRYANDGDLIVQLQGIRWARKVDHQWIVAGKREYRLEVNYRNSTVEMTYDNAPDRDRMFDLIVELLPSKPTEPT